MELAYWHGLPTPPPSPKLNDASNGTDGQADHKVVVAEKLAAQVLAETCQPEASEVDSWTSTMDEAGEALRRKYFRTQYRAVESEVVGLAVKW